MGFGKWFELRTVGAAPPNRGPHKVATQPPGLGPQLDMGCLTIGRLTRSPLAQSPAAVSHDGDMPACWASVEGWREEHHWQAWRCVNGTEGGGGTNSAATGSPLQPHQKHSPDSAAGETEDDCDDPDRMLVYDDIAGHVFPLERRDLQVGDSFMQILQTRFFNLSAHCHPHLKLELVYALLVYLGASPRARTCSSHARVADGLNRATTR